VVHDLFMDRNITGNGKINQDLTFAEKRRTYHGLSQNEERRKKKEENIFIVQDCGLYPT
jgi:hypothetical protein